MLSFLSTCIRMYVCMYTMYVNISYFTYITDTSNVVRSVRIRDDITIESLVVLWDEVMDIFTITYIVT